MKQFAKKIKHVLVKPKDFFKQVKQEKGFMEPLKYLFLFLLITQIFMVFYYFENYFDKFNLELELNLLNYIIVYAITTILTIFISFIRPALTNIFIRLFSKDHKLEDTYKGMVYGLTPDYVATPFFVVTMIFLSATILLKNNWLLILFIISAIITLAAAIYTTILRIYGIAKLHKISFWIAFLCVYIFPVILILLFEIIVLTIVFLIILL
jgi:hypothetical protein